MKFSHRLLLLWLMAWMAVNGAIAGTMGWPAPGPAHEQAAEAGGMPCHDMAAMASAHDDHAATLEQQPTAPAQQDSNCKHCRLCQIAASVLPLVTPALTNLPPVRNYMAAPIVTPPSHIPEPPQHVPLVPAA